MNLLRKIFYKTGKIGLLKWMSDKTYLEILYYLHFGTKLDFNKLTTYNEKLQLLKINDKYSNYSNIVDKYEVRKYISEKIGEEYLIPLLWHGNKFSDVPFDTLPNKFVIKCTHDSGGVVVCNDKENFQYLSAKKLINRSLKRNLYWAAREKVYKNVEPRIIVEKNISINHEYPKDYKFYVFNGEIDCVMVCMGRETGKTLFSYYDLNWNKLHYLKKELETSDEVEKPLNFEKMVEIVRILSKDFLTARIDLYNVDGKIYFGEITFFNQGGFDLDISKETDVYWGNKIKIGE